MKLLHLCMLALIAAAISGCDKSVDSPQGFNLPDGNVAKGKQAFLKYQCLSCHQLEGIEQPQAIEHSILSIPLGGESNKVKTYAALVTGIINPSHSFIEGYPKSAVQIDGKSKMVSFNSVMTVEELVNLVVFLQPYYKLAPSPRTEYSPYRYDRP
ncbi:c-type cytochrome [Shewanella sp. Isolate13]|uniref:c-type cytochrome n=1 Tax=Shewanella sp. Isolate13 TaxID=2908531 RepID=UPI001EFEDB06|nr:c-type cytochrome [Shewanella sp. Isolate13]MCG9731488.1 c-type cytochrome [Shewanella sp. Isolate13]